MSEKLTEKEKRIMFLNFRESVITNEITILNKVLNNYSFTSEERIAIEDALSYMWEKRSETRKELSKIQRKSYGTVELLGDE